MQFLYYLIALAACLGALALIYFLGRDGSRRAELVRRGLSLMLALFFLIRFFGGTTYIESTIGLNIQSPFGAHGGFLVFLSTMLLWMLFAAGIMIACYPFFVKDIKCLKRTVRYVVLGVYFCSFVGLAMLARALDGDLSESLYWRDIILSVEIGLGLGISLYELLERYLPKKFATAATDSDEEKIGIDAAPRWKRFLVSALVFGGMVLITIPNWAPQAILGLSESSLEIDGFNIIHRIVLYICFLLGIPIHMIFSGKSYEIRRFALIYIGLATMISFSEYYIFKDFLNIASWPLHLCNTAMYIVPLCLIFKWDKLYYFTLFINVLGAFLAMIMPNVTANILSAESMRFWTNHYCAFLLPILVISLGIFERPKLKQFLWSLVGFAGYYVVILFINAYLTGKGTTVDFFFINSDFIAEKLGKWAEDIRDIKMSFVFLGVEMVLYPVYQSLFFIVYVLLSLAMWFLYEQAFEIADLYVVIKERSRKIKADRLALEVHLAGRDMQEPMNPQNEGKLILRHFSKRYSTSDVYAVYDANLEIEGGQIFGFLGPNGAGKSTIIKSIVGIQTITSGEIEVSGYDVERQNVGAKMQIGFVPDHYALYENLTGREYINYIADLYEVSREDRDKRIAEYVERFHLQNAFDNPMKTYSHGMKQKITIMSALVHNPKVWILDEPLTGLDPESIFQVKECMKEHARRGNIVFFSTHIIDVVERICDRIAIIRKGQILCTKTVAEIEASGIPLEDFYMQCIESEGDAPIRVGKEAPTEAKG